MNERIRQLAEQSGLRFTQLMSNPMVPVVDGKETDLEKFAQLIVRECEKVAKDGPWYYDTPSLRSGWQNPINHVCNVMKKHFGVEE
jgi:hypothetical protein